MEEHISKTVIINNADEAGNSTKKIQPQKFNYAQDHSNYVLLKELVRNAGPYTLASFINIGGNFAGVYFISYLGINILAASNLTSSVQNWFNSSIGSAVLSVANKAGKIRGEIDKDIENNNLEVAEGKYLLIGRSLQDGWAFSLLLTIPAAGFMFLSKPILLLAGQEFQVVELAKQYFYGYIGGLPAMYMMSCNRKITLAIGEPGVALFFNTFYQVADTALSYLLINGTWGLPKLGFAGLGYSNTITVWISFLLFTAYMAFSPKFKKYGIMKLNIENFWLRVKEQVALGLPFGIKVCAEQGSLLAASLMIGIMLAGQQAAQEVSYQYVFVLSTPMFGIMDTVISQVSSATGAKHLSNAKRIGHLGMGLAVFISLLGLASFITFPKLLLKPFLDVNDPNNQSIVSTACGLLLINGISQVFDSVRNIAMGGLSGFKEIWMPTLYLVLILALINLPLSYALGFPLLMNAIGVMMAREYSIGLGAAIMLYGWMNKNTLPKENDSRPSIDEVPSSAQKRSCGVWQSWANFKFSNLKKRDDSEKNRLFVLEKSPENTPCCLVM